MNARLSNLQETPLVEVSGDIDHSTGATLETILDEAWSGGSPVLLLDLSGVDYIDSGGLSVLFSQARKLEDDGWLGLIAPNANVHRLLEIVGVLADPRFKVLPDRPAARAALGGEDRS
jgi:anti-sigma B factor antagonist